MKSPWETAGGGNWNPNGQGNLQGGGWMPGAPQMPNWSNPQTIPSGNWNNSGAPNPSWTQSGTSPGKSWATVVRPSNDPQMQPGGNGQGRPQPRFDPTTGSWGGNKIDQGTPWDVVHPEGN